MTTPATPLLCTNGHALPPATSTCPRCGAAVSDESSRQPWSSPQRWRPPTGTPGPWYNLGAGPYPPPPPAPPRATNTLAVAAMVLGVLWIWWVGSILALVFGYIALRQIRASNQSGRGMAIAGIVLGWVGAAVGIVALIGACVTAGDHRSVSSAQSAPPISSSPLPFSSTSPGGAHRRRRPPPRRPPPRRPRPARPHAEVANRAPAGGILVVTARRSRQRVDDRRRLRPVRFQP